MLLSHERDCCLGWLLAKTLQKEILKRAGISRVKHFFLRGWACNNRVFFGFFFNISLIPQVAGNWTMDRHLT